MKKKILVLLLMLTIICAMFSLVACSSGSGNNYNEDGSVNSSKVFKLNKDGVITSLTKFGKTLEEIVIPEEIDGKKVTGIGEDVFNRLSSLKSIKIPSSVTSIGDRAFVCCVNLKSVEIPSGVTSIGDNAFSGCDGLRSIYIPSNVTSIGEFAFHQNGGNIIIIYCEAESKPSGWDSQWNSDMPVVWDCKELGTTDSGIKWKQTNGETIIVLGYSGTSTDVVIPSTINGHNVIGIESKAFYNCSSLESIEIPSGVTSIGDSAFYGCESLKNISIPSGVTSIGDSAFYGCESLKNISIPSSLTSIGKSAFEECCSLEYNKDNYGLYLGNKENPYLAFIRVQSQMIYNCAINNRTKFIYDYAFEWCSILTSIEIPSSVTSIGTAAFCDCRSLKSIEIPSIVTSIGECAFESCSSLTSIVIPRSVTNIGENAFLDCRALTINCEAESKPSGWHSDWNYGGGSVVWGYKG